MHRLDIRILVETWKHQDVEYEVPDMDAFVESRLNSADTDDSGLICQAR